MQCHDISVKYRHSKSPSRTVLKTLSRVNKAETTSTLSSGYFFVVVVVIVVFFVVVVVVFFFFHFCCKHAESFLVCDFCLHLFFFLFLRLPISATYFVLTFFFHLKVTILLLLLGHNSKRLIQCVPTIKSLSFLIFENTASICLLQDLTRRYICFISNVCSFCVF